MIYEDVIVDALEHAKIKFKESKPMENISRIVGEGASGDSTLLLDKIVEEEILTFLNEKIGRCLIVSEEAGVVGEQSSELTVLVDPVDGSTNASRGIPLFSSSIAIAKGRRFSDIEAAGTIDLVSGELITATRGRGCRVDGREAHPSRTDDLRSALVSLSLRVKGEYRNDPNILVNLINNIRHPRILGTAALETAYVAIGRVDGFVEPYPRLRTYDCLPSLFLVKEAKGTYKMLQRSLQDIDLRTKETIGYAAAGCGSLLEKLLKLLA